MWVYRQVKRHVNSMNPGPGAVLEVGGENVYEVGFFAPNGDWHRDSSHKSRDTAGNRVNYLNGGSGGRVQRVEVVDQQRFYEPRNSGPPSVGSPPSDRQERYEPGMRKGINWQGRDDRG